MSCRLLDFLHLLTNTGLASVGGSGLLNDFGGGDTGEDTSLGLSLYDNLEADETAFGDLNKHERTLELCGVIFSFCSDRERLNEGLGLVSGVVGSHSIGFSDIIWPDSREDKPLGSCVLSSSVSMSISSVNPSSILSEPEDRLLKSGGLFVRTGDLSGERKGLRDSTEGRRGATPRGSANLNGSWHLTSSLSGKLAPYPLSWLLGSQSSSGTRDLISFEFEN